MPCILLECILLLPANGVCEGYVFTGVCLSTGGVCMPCMVTCMHTPGMHVPQAHTCPWHACPWVCMPPLGKHTTQDTHDSQACTSTATLARPLRQILRDKVNERTARILMECILVRSKFLKHAPPRDVYKMESQTESRYNYSYLVLINELDFALILKGRPMTYATCMEIP